MAPKLSSETRFLREFAKAYVSETAFTNVASEDLADIDLRGCKIGLADVIFVLKYGDVTVSEKDEADGSQWQVEGETCDGNFLVVLTEVWCDRYHVRIRRVKLVGVPNGNV